MSNIIKRLIKQSHKLVFKRKRKEYKSPPKKYTSFNIFTRDGENLTVDSPKPMTVDEARYYFKALSISGNEK